MTTYFVSNAGSNTAPYDTEAKAATTLAVVAAIPWAAADTVKISSTHTETAGAALTYTFPTTTGLKLVSVLFNGSGTGAVTAGAAINVGAASAALTLASGFVYGYGITWKGGTNNSASCTIVVGSGSNLVTSHVWDTCTFNAASTNTSARVLLGLITGSSTQNTGIDLVNCTINNAANKSILLRQGTIRIRNLALTGTAPTSVFLLSDATPTNAEIDASDLSNLAWTNLVSLAHTWFKVSFTNCKLRSGFSITTGTFDSQGSYVEIIDCASGDTNYGYVFGSYAGTITADNSKYAKAYNGSDHYSLLMASSANASFASPLTSPEMSYFNDTLSAMTTKIAVAHNAVGGGTGGTLLNSDMWNETVAKITSGAPLGTWNTADRVANILTAGSDQDTDSTTVWTGSSIATHNALISGSFTPAEIGPIAIIAKLAKASVSVYMDPQILPISSKTWLTRYGSYNNERSFASAGLHPIDEGIAA